LKRLPKAEDVEDLKSYVVDNIENFAFDNKTFHEDFKTHCEIIRRYDEVITTKAEKFVVDNKFKEMDARILEEI